MEKTRQELVLRGEISSTEKPAAGELVTYSVVDLLRTFCLETITGTRRFTRLVEARTELGKALNEMCESFHYLDTIEARMEKEDAFVDAEHENKMAEIRRQGMEIKRQVILDELKHEAEAARLRALRRSYDENQKVKEKYKTPEERAAEQAHEKLKSAQEKYRVQFEIQKGFKIMEEELREKLARVEITQEEFDLLKDNLDQSLRDAFMKL